MSRQVSGLHLIRGVDGAQINVRIIDRLHPYDVYLNLLKSYLMEAVVAQQAGQDQPEVVRSTVGPTLRKLILGDER